MSVGPIDDTIRSEIQLSFERLWQESRVSLDVGHLLILWTIALTTEKGPLKMHEVHKSLRKDICDASNTSSLTMSYNLRIWPSLDPSVGLTYGVRNRHLSTYRHVMICYTDHSNNTSRWGPKVIQCPRTWRRTCISALYYVFCPL